MNEPELNAEMHRLMGWVYDESRKCWQRNGYWTAEPDHYTTDPATAMLVLEKCMKETAFPIMVGVMYGGYYCELGTQMLLGIMPDINQWKAWPTLPLAICLFAKQLFTSNAAKQ